MTQPTAPAGRSMQHARNRAMPYGALIGQRGALRALAASHGPLTTLSGPPGVGKTRIAQTLEAHEFFVLGATPVHEIDKYLASTIGSIVVLDGAECIQQDFLAHLDGWVARARRSKTRLVVTSRIRTRHLANVGIDVAPLLDDEAVQLFCERSALPANDAIRALVGALDRLPLALELAAARAAVLPPADLLARTDEHLDLLRSVGASARDMRAAFVQSWLLLTPALQQALVECSLFRSAFTLSCARQVLSAGRDALDALEALSDASLLQTTTSTSGARFSMLGLLRAFTSEHTPSIDARARHAHWVAGAASRHLDEHQHPRDQHAADALVGMVADLESGLDYALESAPAQILPLLGAIDVVARQHAPLLVHFERLTRVLASNAVRSDLELTCRIHLMRARTGFDAGRATDALGDLSSARLLIHILDAGELEREADAALSMMLHWEGKFDEALAMLESREPGDVRNPDQILREVATLEYGRGHVRKARDIAIRALALAERAGDRRHEGMLLAMLALFTHDLGELPAARAAFWTAFSQQAETGDSYAAAVTRNWYAQLLMECGDLDGARVDFERSRAALENMGDQRFLRAVLGYQGILAHLGGDLESAATLLERSAEMSRRGKDHYRLHHVLPHLGLVQARLGRTADALTSFAVANGAAAKPDANPNLRVVAEVLAAFVDSKGSANPVDEETLARVRAGAAARQHESSDVRLALHVVATCLAAIPSLRIDAAGRWFERDQEPRVNLLRRKPLARMLAFLAQQRELVPGQSLSSTQLLEAGWPGERLSHQAGIHRVHVAISTLRGFGLSTLLSEGGGYRLSEAVHVALVGSEFERAP